MYCALPRVCRSCQYLRLVHREPRFGRHHLPGLQSGVRRLRTNASLLFSMRFGTFGGRRSLSDLHFDSVLRRSSVHVVCSALRNLHRRFDLRHLLGRLRPQWHRLRAVSERPVHRSGSHVPQLLSPVRQLHRRKHLHELHPKPPSAKQRLHPMLLCAVLER